jgi:hypothetical protein
VSARLYSLDSERARRQPTASPSTRDALARVVVLEPGPVAPLVPPRQSALTKWRGGLIVAGFRAIFKAARWWKEEAR